MRVVTILGHDLGQARAMVAGALGLDVRLAGAGALEARPRSC